MAARHQFAWVWGRESLFRLGLSLILALALWLYITTKENPAVLDYGQPLQITAQNLSRAYTLTNNLGSVRIRIRIDNPNQLVTTSNFRAFVNLIGKGPGVYTSLPVQVLPDPPNPGIHVVQVSPATVSVSIDRLRNLVLPVRAILLHRPPIGYTLSRPQVTPPAVTVQGPNSIISEIARAVVEVDLTDVRSTIQVSPKLLFTDSRGNPVTGTSTLLADPPIVTVTVPVYALKSYKTVPLLINLQGQPRAGYGVGGVTVDPPDITVQGSPKRLSSVTSVTTSAVSLSHRGGGIFRTRLGIRLKPGVSSSTHFATVTVQLIPVDASSSIPVAVTPENVMKGLVPRIQPASILVTVVGPSSKLASAGRSMRAVLDLASYGAGTYQLAPQLTWPSGLHIGEVNPRLVTVILQPAPVG